ncbi:Spy/CpxP family protein refolding chaperone [Almyronema epifaneia]|uniref:Spy/CpxP family protein refolding chaperone n=1 Tax=Almyronema epifaneia S1 TaxID=2991925 RepID=A0ABW6IF30_9CYAN
MSLRRTVLLSMLSLSLLSGGTFAFAQMNSGATRLAQQPIEADEDFGPGAGRGEGRRGDRWLEQLDLTDAQTAQIQTIKEQARTNNAGLRQQLQQAHEELQSLMASDASSDQLRQQHQQVQTLKNQLATQRFEMMLAIREVLTPDQRAELATLTSNRPGPRGSR